MHTLLHLACLACLAASAARPEPEAAAAPKPEAAPVAMPKVFLTQDEALELAFPKCEVKRQTIALSKDERARLEKLAGKDVDCDRRLFHTYEAYKDGKLVGTAYFDAHRVRTLDEVLMFVVDKNSRIERLEMLSFGEPQDYIPRAKWYAQFIGKELNEKLRLKRDIKGVTGATLTAVATAEAARRTLALHKVLAERKAAPPVR